MQRSLITIVLALLAMSGCGVTGVAKPADGLVLLLRAEPLRAGAPVDSGRLQEACKILEERAQALGASQPTASIQGENNIQLTLPGLRSSSTAEGLLTPGLVEFIDSGDTPLKTGSWVTTTLGPPSPEQALQTPGEPGSLLDTGGLSDVAPDPLSIWQVVVSSDDMDTGKTAVEFDKATNQPQVAFVLNDSGKAKLAEFTRTHVGKYMPIVLDKRVLSSPSIQAPITGGEGIITGITLMQANNLKVQLKTRSLPVGLRITESRTISGSPVP